MKKVFLIAGLFCLTISTCYAEASAVACFQEGFRIASKAYNEGDSSAFTPVYGMAPKMAKRTSCCDDNFNNMDKGCTAFNSAFMVVQQGGPTRHSASYMQYYQAMQAIDAGLLGF